jgi:protein-tyrosine phosphatase
LLMTFSVAFVCTGNICRSPVAERLFRARVPKSADVLVWSAGTRGLTGRGIDDPSAFALRELGIDPDGHVAQRLDLDSSSRADLVLCASTEHRGIVLRSVPLMMARTFTMREFSRLAQGAGELPRRSSPFHAAPDTEELRKRVRLIAGQRGHVAIVDAVQDDIADPYGANLDVARRCVRQISAAVDGALDALSLR